MSMQIGRTSSYGKAEYDKLLANRGNISKAQSGQQEYVMPFGEQKEIKIDVQGEEDLKEIAQQRKAQQNTYPYAFMADPKTGELCYNGVTFQPDPNRNAICLGDMNKEENVLTIPLSGGGNLRVNRDNIDDLGKAIGMFSPEDVRRIMEAISLDAKVQKEKAEIEEQKIETGRKISDSKSSEKEEPVKEMRQTNMDVRNVDKQAGDLIQGTSWDVRHAWEQAKIHQVYQENRIQKTWKGEEIV